MTFKPAERDYIRRELDMFFSTFPTVAEGFLRTDSVDASRKDRSVTALLSERTTTARIRTVFHARIAISASTSTGRLNGSPCIPTADRA
jgi:hypothetical protein